MIDAKSEVNSGDMDMSYQFKIVPIDCVPKEL